MKRRMALNYLADDKEREVGGRRSPVAARCFVDLRGSRRLGGRVCQGYLMQPMRIEQWRWCWLRARGGAPRTWGRPARCTWAARCKCTDAASTAARMPPRAQAAYARGKLRLMRKATELAVQCNAQVALVMFDAGGRLTQFSTSDMDQLLEHYGAAVLEPHERYTPQDVSVCRGGTGFGPSRGARLLGRARPAAPRAPAA